MTISPSVVVPGKVDKIIPSLTPNKEDTVQISLDTDHDLYREVRIENTLVNEDGDKVSLKVGAPVEVTVSADEQDTTPQSEKSANPRTPKLGGHDSEERQLNSKNTDATKLERRKAS